MCLEILGQGFLSTMMFFEAGWVEESVFQGFRVLD